MPIVVRLSAWCFRIQLFDVRHVYSSCCPVSYRAGWLEQSSVPFQLAGQQLDARYTAMTVEIFHRGTRVALPYPQLRCLCRHHHSRTPTQESSGPSGVDTLAFDQLGRTRRSGHGRWGQGLTAAKMRNASG